MSSRMRGALALAFHMSACRATSFSSTRSPVPPMRMGGCGSWRGFGVPHGGRDVMVPALHRGALWREHAADDRARLVERGQTARDGLEVDAEAAVLELEPAGADAEVQAPAADVVDGGRHLGGDGGMAGRVAAHPRADACARGRPGPGGERPPAPPAP